MFPAVCLVAVLAALGALGDGSPCTYTEYGAWSVLGSNRKMTVTQHGETITVTAVDYGLGALDFNRHWKTECDYSTNDPNGWSVVSSGTNGCVQTVRRDFAKKLFTDRCSEVLSGDRIDGSEGYSILTQVGEKTIPLFTGTMLDGTISTVVMTGRFSNELRFPSDYLTVRTYGDDITSDGDVRSTYVKFAILMAMSVALLVGATALVVRRFRSNHARQRTHTH